MVNPLPSGYSFIGSDGTAGQARAIDAAATAAGVSLATIRYSPDQNGYLVPTAVATAYTAAPSDPGDLFGIPTRGEVATLLGQRVAASSLRQLRPVGAGAQPVTTAGTALGSGNSQTGGTGVQRIVSAVALNLFKIQWGNFSTGNAEASAGYGDMTIVAATVEYPSGTFTPVFFNGTTGTVIKAGGIATSDDVALNIPTNTPYWIRTFCTWTAAANIPVQSIVAVNGQSANLATSPTDKTQTVGSVGGDTFGPAPIAVLAHVPASTGALVVFGDSIANGTGDYPDQSRGYIRLATDGIYPVQKLTAPGGRAMYEVANTTHWRKWRLVLGATCALELMGTNDVGASRTLAQVQGDKITLWQNLRATPGMQTIYTATVLPTTASTDGWTTATNQTPNGTETVRTNLNDWIRDGAPLVSTSNLTPATTGTVGALRAGQTGHPLSGYLELADKVEANSANTLTRNGGRWFVPTLRTVTDAAVTSGSYTLTSATANFTAADVGVAVNIAGAGTSGGTYTASIAAVNSTTQVTLDNGSGVKPATTVSAATTKIGGWTQEGIHPSTPAHTALATVVTAALATITA